MKFRRIDEETVRCIISKEDMQEYGIVLEDFFKNKGKIHDFLHVVVERAEQEVGYEPKDGLLSMQIMPLSPNTISITFSEQGTEDYENMMKNLKDAMTNQEELKDAVTTEADSEYDQEEETDDYDDEDDEDEEEIEAASAPTEKARENQYKDGIGMENARTIMIGMKSMEQMAEFCRILGIDRTVRSELYWLQNKDMYCMIIEKDRLSVKLMKHILLLAVEYTPNITDELKIISYIREHGECIIDKSAFRILKKYA